MAIDPVCGMTVEPEKAKATSVYKGAAIYFCAQNCKKRFDADPESFMARISTGGSVPVPSPEKGKADTAIDPVCGMTVQKSEAAGTSEYEGKTYYFCNVKCKIKFDGGPAGFLSPKVAAHAMPAASMLAEKPSKGLKKIILPVTGMSCASCAARIEKGLSALSGIHGASVNFAAGTVTISYDPEEVHLSKFVETVRELGYEAGVEQASLPVRGMSCASCVEKIERALNGLDGVISASVNFASERANINYIGSVVDVEDFVKAVRNAGYEAFEAEKEEDKIAGSEQARKDELWTLKSKFLFAAIISVPVFLGAFSDVFTWAPAVLKHNITLFMLATPVQFWSGWQFYRRAWASAMLSTSSAMSSREGRE